VDVVVFLSVVLLAVYAAVRGPWVEPDPDELRAWCVRECQRSG
jgi:hypothetical protein